MTDIYRCAACSSIVDDAPPNHYGLVVKFESKRKDGQHRSYTVEVDFGVTAKEPWRLLHKGEEVKLCPACLADGLEEIVRRLRGDGRWRADIIKDRRAERLEIVDGKAVFLD